MKWSADDLALAAEVGVSTFRRFESVEGVPSGQIRVLDAVKRVIESAGIEFVGTPDDRPGVRIK